jgi:single-stranded DNA-binding protein
MSLDVHIFNGRAAADPETRFMGNGDPVTKFSIALGRGKEKPAIYPDFVGFGETAKKMGESIKKGSKVAVLKSRLNIRTYTGQDGVSRKATEYVIDSPSDFYVEWTPESSDGTDIVTTTAPAVATNNTPAPRPPWTARTPQAPRVTTQTSPEEMFPEDEA